MTAMYTRGERVQWLADGARWLPGQVITDQRWRIHIRLDIGMVVVADPQWLRREQVAA